MSRSLEKGPFVDEKLYRKVERQGCHRAAHAHQDLGPRLHDRARVRRAHVPGAQRPALHRRVRDRGHGRSQARRVQPRPGSSAATRTRRKASRPSSDRPAPDEPGESHGLPSHPQIRPHRSAQGPPGRGHDPGHEHRQGHDRARALQEARRVVLQGRPQERHRQRGGGRRRRAPTLRRASRASTRARRSSDSSPRTAAGPIRSSSGPATCTSSWTRGTEIDDHGTEDPSIRIPRRHHRRPQVALVRPEGALRRAARRGLPHPQVRGQAAEPHAAVRRGLRHPHRADPRGADDHRQDRAARPRHRARRGRRSSG